MKKRKIDIAVISDVHLGSFKCHSEELLIYLNSIQPEKLILNGNILNIGQFHQGYFPASHLKVLQKLLDMSAKGTEVHYLTGKYDGPLRSISDMSMGNFHIQDELIYELDGKKAWFFHGDAFDFSLQNAKRLAHFGVSRYSFFLRLNKIVYALAKVLGREPLSISKRLKNGDKDTKKIVADFEKTVTDIAISKECDYVICGYTRQPKKERVVSAKGRCTYLNAGDWLKHLTALEYSFKRWKIYRYNHDKLSPFFADEDIKQMDMRQLVASITSENEH